VAGLFLGLMVRDRDGSDGIAMAFIFPAMFPSGIFVPVGGLPTPLIATGPLPDVWTLQHPVLASLGWAVLFMVVFIPLAVRRYQRMGR
jgi:ABC-2 type transport system permease protein